MRSLSIVLSALLLVFRLSAIAAFDEDQPNSEQGLTSATWQYVVRQSIVTPKATWCIALKTVDDFTLQSAIDYACGQTTADCKPIEFGAPCFFPNTIAYHASYVFNSYYQMNAKGANTCSFGGIATVTADDPSQGACKFPSSGSLNQSTRVLENDGTKVGPHGVHILVILCLLICMMLGDAMAHW